MEKKLLIEGMSCNHCVNHVRTALTEDIKGVEVREVSLDGKYAIVNMDDSVKEEELKDFTENVMTKQGRLMANCCVPLKEEDVYGIYKALYK